MAIDVDAFMPIEQFKTRMAQFLAEIRSQPKMPGVDRIYTPGEIEAERYWESERHGIVLPDTTELDQLASRLNVRMLHERMASSAVDSTENPSLN
jgi:LDH2 family malate/lactate/ureidoglycolate dehydrogenase